MSNEVIEIASFKTLPQTSNDELLAAVRDSEVFLNQQPGYLGRYLVGPGDDGVWRDIVRWSSHEDAVEAAQKIMQSAEASRFMMLINPESVVMEHRPLAHVTG